MKRSNYSLRTLLISFLVLSIFTQCTSSADQLRLSDYPYLFGKWSGEGHFVHQELNAEMGEFPVELKIDETGAVAQIGEATVEGLTMESADFGFVFVGDIEQRINQADDQSKAVLVFLLVLPDSNRELATTSEANFHLKSNRILDLDMKVGGVLLTKE